MLSGSHHHGACISFQLSCAVLINCYHCVMCRLAVIVVSSGSHRGVWSGSHHGVWSGSHRGVSSGSHRCVSFCSHRAGCTCMYSQSRCRAVGLCLAFAFLQVTCFSVFIHCLIHKHSTSCWYKKHVYRTNDRNVSINVVLFTVLAVNLESIVTH